MIKIYLKSFFKKNLLTSICLNISGLTFEMVEPITAVDKDGKPVEENSESFKQFFSINATTGVNFINVKRANFSYERHFGSFFLVTCTKKNDVRTQNLYI